MSRLIDTTRMTDEQLEQHRAREALTHALIDTLGEA